MSSLGGGWQSIAMFSTSGEEANVVGDSAADEKRRAACERQRQRLLRQATQRSTIQLLMRASGTPEQQRLIRKWSREYEGFEDFLARYCMIGRQLLQAHREQAAARAGSSRPSTPPAAAAASPPRSPVNRRRSAGQATPMLQVPVDFSVYRGVRLRSRTAPAQVPLSPRVLDRLYKR